MDATNQRSMIKQSNNLCFGSLKKLLLLAIVVLISQSASGKVTWYFQAGGIWGTRVRYSEVEYKPISVVGPWSVVVPQKDWKDFRNGIKNSYEIATGLYLQIPLKAKNIFIDTGLGYRYKNIISCFDLDISEQFRNNGTYKLLSPERAGHSVEIPVRLGYQINLNEKNSFQFKLGPYISYVFYEFGDADYYGYSGYINNTKFYNTQHASPISVGLSPSIMYKHRAIAIGATMNSACFYNGPRDVKNTTFNLVLAIHFGSWNWDAIADGLSVAGNVLGTVSDTYMQIQNNGGSSDYYNSSDYDDTNYSNSSSGSSSGSNGKSLSEQQSYNTDKRTYERYDSQLSSHFAGNQKMSSSSVRQAQKKMKDLRQKWERKGRSFPHSQNESR